MLLGLACSREAPEAGAPAARGSPTALPELVETLRRDLETPRHPSDGGGRAWLDTEMSSATVRAGEAARFRIVYEAGPLGIAVGGALYLQSSPFWGWSPPQLAAPDALGFTTVETEAEGVALRPFVHGGGLLEIGIAGRVLAAGERVVVDYGAGEAGALADGFAEREETLFLAVDGDGDGARQLIEAPPTVEIVAGEPAALVAFLPATARPGQTVTLRVAALDRVGNAGARLEGAIALELPPGLAGPARLELDDEGRAEAPLSVRAPGVHRVRVAHPWPLAAESNPLVADASHPRILVGDLHGHSNLSDGTGTPEDFYVYAREIAGLDVAALTDHDHWGLRFLDQSPTMWQRIAAAARDHHDPRHFVTLLGYEWTNWLFGHRHVLHFTDEGPLISSIDPASDEPEELWAALRGRASLTFAHHSAGGPVAIDWSIPPDPVLEPVTEIVSVHGSSEAPDSPLPIYSAVAGNWVRDVLDLDHRLGFVGSGDGHDGHPGLAHFRGESGGLAMLLAPEATREAVLAALRARRCYATNGPRIVLQATLAGQPIGAVVAAGRAELRVRAAAPAPLERLDLVRDGEVALAIDLEGSREIELGLEIGDLEDGDWLYLRLVQRDGGAAWSSPFFVEGRR